MEHAVTSPDWQTYCGGSADDTYSQNPEFVVKAPGHSKVVVNWEILKATNVDIYLQTAKVQEKKYWRDTKTLTGSGSTVLTRDLGQTTDFLEDYLRFRLAANGASWQATLRIQYFLK